MQKDALEIFIEELLPLASLLTPNIPEAEVLADMKIANEEEMISLLKKFLRNLDVQLW